MLAIDDVGKLFAVLRAAYGYKWAHGADAVPVWQKKLRQYTPKQVLRAASAAIDQHEQPPTLAQFLLVIKAQQPRNTTYLLPAPFDQANANKAWDHMEKLAGKSLRPSKEKM